MSYRNIVRLSAALRTGTREMTAVFDGLTEEEYEKIAAIATRNPGYVPKEVQALLKEQGFLAVIRSS